MLPLPKLSLSHVQLSRFQVKIPSPVDEVALLVVVLGQHDVEADVPHGVQLLVEVVLNQARVVHSPALQHCVNDRAIIHFKS